MNNIKVTWNLPRPSAKNILVPTVSDRMTDARNFYEKGAHSLGTVGDVD